MPARGTPASCGAWCSRPLSSLVFEHDVQCDVFRRIGCVFRRTLRHDDDRFVAIRGILAARRLAVDRYVAGVEPELQAAAGKLRHQAGDDFVEAVAAGLRRQFERDRRQVDSGFRGQELGIAFLVEIRVKR
jgi:hypothetical protein